MSGGASGEKGASGEDFLRALTAPVEVGPASRVTAEGWGGPFRSTRQSGCSTASLLQTDPIAG
eukprot:9469805-Pyramimonas_sp.AAC.1